ncbi:MAG: TonB-dependent siderophore receptor [Opitutales bacterium]
MNSTNKPIRVAALAGLAIAMSANGQSDDSILELETFIAEETSVLYSDTLNPNEQVVSGAFFDNMTLLEVPRSVTVLTPEALDQFNIEDFHDLSKIGAGTETINFYGVPGTPTIRGWKGGIYYNGMLRAYQRNEMPTSFGAMEALEIVKGPAPAHLIPSHVGGYVNMLPKQPFFDEDFGGSVEFEVGSWDKYKTKLDVGGSMLIGEVPSAYRFSITNQLAESYYDNVGNDFTSIYGSAKFKLSEKTKVFIAAEYYIYNSNENAGWNRPTQNLVDNGEYVIGEPLSLVRTSKGGVADRGFIDGTTFGFLFNDANQRALFRSLVVPSDVISGAVSSGQISAAQRDLLVDMSDSANQEAVYAGLPADMAKTTSGFVYTPEYFEAGGTVFTEDIEGSTVLADPSDFADSEDFLFFGELDHSFSEDLGLTYNFFSEYIDTDKLSSYGYGFQSEQFVLDNKVSVNQRFNLGGAQLDLTYGLQARLVDATQLQDFWTEPFARRDITREEISANSVILAGGQVDPATGNNFWGGGFGAGGPGGHAVTSETWTYGGFAVGNLKVGESFNVMGSLRWDTFDVDVGIPEGPTDVFGPDTSFSDDEISWAINPVFIINERFSLYGVAQESTTLAALQGGPILNAGNLGTGELYEGGFKASIPEINLFISAAYYEWEQSSFNDRDATSEQFESEGVEVEVTWQATDNLTLIAAFTDSETRKIDGLGFRTMPFGLTDPTGANDPEIGVALNGGILMSQFTEPFGGFTPEGGTPSANPELESPGFPETTFKLYAVARDLGIDGLGVTGGFVWRDEYWHNYDRTILLPSSTIASLNVFYETDKFEVLLGVENLTDEDYFLGADPEFGANTLLTKAPERNYRAQFTYKF